MAAPLSTLGILQALLLPVLWSVEVQAIDCYKCYSFNKSDTKCGDPFHPAYGNYVKECTEGRDGHVGQYPTKYCIKLIGTTVKNDVEIVIRGCSQKSLDSQCGQFKYEDVRYSGCVMSCMEDGCNRTSGRKPDVMLITVISLIVLAILTCSHFHGS